MQTLRLFNERISLRYSTRMLLTTTALVGLLFCLFIASLLIGEYSLSIGTIINTLFQQYGDQQANLIMWEFRLPRSLVAMCSGALFAISGALLQNLTRNPLADPSLIGISHGAALAVVILTLIFPEYIDQWREVFAFLGAISVAVLLQCLRGKGQALKFILLGIGVVAFISAIISTLITYGEFNAAMSALTWLSGSIHRANWADVSLLLSTTLLISAGVLYQGRTMAALHLGQQVAIGLGVAVHKASLLQLFLSVMAAAIATAVVGPIGFVGLLAPHLARKILNQGVTNHFILTALCGAILVLAADMLGSHLFAPTQLAAGLMTSLIGAPLFAYLLIKRS